MPHPQPASSSARFLDESVLPIFTDLRMTAFGQSVIDIAADPAFVDALRLVRLPYHLSALTQAAATAALTARRRRAGLTSNL